MIWAVAAFWSTQQPESSRKARELPPDLFYKMGFSNENNLRGQL